MILIVKRTQTSLSTSFFLFLGILFFVPEGIAEAAGVVPCGGRGEPVCTLCHFIVGIHGIIDWFMRVMVFVALTIITAMGVLYIVSGGNEGITKTAKNGLSNALKGVLIVLFAWFIVNVILFWLLPTFDDLGVEADFKLTSGFNFECDLRSTANTAGFDSVGAPGTSPGTGTTPGGTPSTAASCQPLTSGACSVANLTPIFGTNAERMSRICNYESGGNATMPSGSDICRNDPQRRAFSIGLFQINLTVNSVNGLNCPNAFRGTNYDCSITNETLYSQCVTAAENPAYNIAAAARLSSNGSNIRPWRNTVNTCGIQ